MHAIIVEFFSTLLLSVFVLFFASRWITNPVEKLTNFITSDIQSIRPNEIPALDSNDEVGKLARRFRTLVSDSQSYIEEIETLNTKDALTGLYNRRFYSEFVEEEFAIASRTQNVISFFYIEIDNFKKYYDNYGHKIGDTVLTKVAQILKSSLDRKSDLCFRLGGEEFLIIVSMTTAAFARCALLGANTLWQINRE